MLYRQPASRKVTLRCQLEAAEVVQGAGKNDGEHGFTLMEMVVAVFIVSVMTAVVMPHLIGTSKRAETSVCEQNQRTIRAALSEYYMLNHVYPSGNTTVQLQSLETSQILQSIPREPTGGNYTIDDTDANNVVVSCDVHGELGNDQ